MTKPRLLHAVLAICAVMVLSAAVPAASQAAACDAPILNEVACENTKPGADPSTWQIDQRGRRLDPGLRHVDERQQGRDGQLQDQVRHVELPHRHPAPRLLRRRRRAAHAGRTWRRRARRRSRHARRSWRHRPGRLRQLVGVALVDRPEHRGVGRLHRAPRAQRQRGREPHRVRRARRRRHVQVVLQTSDATWQAYNTYGGNSLYTCEPDICPPTGSPTTYKAAYKVSYNRPFNTAADDGGRSWLFSGGEYPMIRFLEANGYNVSYISGVDMHAARQRAARPQPQGVRLERPRRVLVGVAAHEHGERARDAGINLAFFTGNTGFWKTRWEPSAAGASTPDRTLVSYKDTHFSAQEDPVAFTGTWRDPRLTTAAAGPTPENALTGLSFLVNSGTSRDHRPVRVPQHAHVAQHRRDLAARRRHAAAGARTRSATSGTSTPTTASAPAAWSSCPRRRRPASRCSPTTAAPSRLGGTATHNLTMYKAASGARVFNSGTVQWSWGLDDRERGRQRRSTATCSRRRSTSSPTSARSRTPCCPGSSADGDDRRDGADGDDHEHPVDRRGRHERDDLRHRVRLGRPGGRRRGLDGQRRHLASHHGHDRAGRYSWIAHGNPSTVVKVARRSTTAATSAAPRPARPSP